MDVESARTAPRPLRIVSVCRTLPNPDDPSGGVFVLNRGRAMAAHSDLHMIQPLPYVPVLKPLPGWARAPRRDVQGLDVLHAPMLYLPGVFKHADGAWLERSVAGLIGELHRRQAIDAIDAHFGYPEGVGCWYAARRLGIPFFITVRGFENEYVTVPRVGPRMIAALRAATGCITVSHSLRKLIVEHGVQEDRVRVIHNAIDTNVFHHDDSDAARARLQLTGGQRLVVSVGHLVSRKRHHVLIEAFAALRDKHADLQLAIIGANSFEKNYPAQLVETAKRLNVANSVRFVGNVPPTEVVDWLRAADVFALGTAREGCCNAVLEALAAGAPVVTTPAGDNAYFVRDNENGFIVPVDDTGRLAAAMELALARDWDRPTIARRLFEQAGSWDSVGRNVLSFIRERVAEDGR